MQYYTQYNSIVTATKYHATKPIYQIEVETETLILQSSLLYSRFVICDVSHNKPTVHHKCYTANYDRGRH